MRPRHEHDRNFRRNADHRNSNASNAEQQRSAVVTLDANDNRQFEVISPLLDLIRLSHFEPSLRPCRKARQGGEKCGESSFD
jgi:hypothetical protein